MGVSGGGGRGYPPPPCKTEGQIEDKGERGNMEETHMFGFIS